MDFLRKEAKMKKAILVVLLAFSANAKGFYRIIGSNNVPCISCYVSVQSSGCIPQNTILYPADSYDAAFSKTFTNGLFCFRHYARIPNVITSFVSVGGTTITNVIRSVETVHDFQIGNRILKHRENNLFIDGSDFIKIASTNIPDEKAMIRNNQQKQEALKHNAKVASEAEKVKGFLATTNTATLAELQAKGVDIRFREILSVDYTANGSPIIRRRWVMCSEAFGEPLGNFY